MLHISKVPNLVTSTSYNVLSDVTLNFKMNIIYSKSALNSGRLQKDQDINYPRHRTLNFKRH